MTGKFPRPHEEVRLSAPELAQRGRMAITRKRLLLASAGFAVLFIAVAVRLAVVSLLAPGLTPAQLAALAASHKQDQLPPAADDADEFDPIAPSVAHPRADIIDRNGVVLATSLPTANLVVDPNKMRKYGYDPLTVARQIVKIVPSITVDWVARWLSANTHSVTLAYRISPDQEVALNDLGVIGLDFEAGEKRSYPLGVMAAHVLGAVGVDGHGLAGVEKEFDQRLTSSTQPLRLSIDVRVQNVVREELSAAMAEFTPTAAVGMVMDVRTGELLAMVSLPDYDANQYSSYDPRTSKLILTNHAVADVYEPGSTFKLQTAAMALQDNVVHIWDQFDAVHPIIFGRFHITDFEGKHRFLYLPEVLAYSSNLGAGHIADEVGAQRQRAWLARMGMLSRAPIELPEARREVLAPKPDHWGRLETITIGFGQGISVTPLHVIRGVAIIANGGYVIKPTILAREPEGDTAPGVIRTAEVNGIPLAPMLSPYVADVMRRLMRLVVTAGYGKSAEVPGYFVGGKTGTAEIVQNGHYLKHHNDSAFVSVFPMNNPRYAVYMMLDDPHGTKATGGFSTAGMVAAPAAGRVIARIAPMLGLLPDTQDAAAIDHGLSIPLQPVVNQVLPRPYLVPADSGEAPLATPMPLRQASYVPPAGGSRLAAR